MVKDTFLGIIKPKQDLEKKMAAFYKLFFIVFIIIYFQIFCEKIAYAYLDPGSGSFIFQIFIAGFLGALVVAKRFWINIKTFFRKMFSISRQK